MILVNCYYLRSMNNCCHFSNIFTLAFVWWDIQKTQRALMHKLSIFNIDRFRYILTLNTHTHTHTSKQLLCQHLQRFKIKTTVYVLIISAVVHLSTSLSMRLSFRVLTPSEQPFRLCIIKDLCMFILRYNKYYLEKMCQKMHSSCFK